MPGHASLSAKETRINEPKTLLSFRTRFAKACKPHHHQPNVPVQRRGRIGERVASHAYWQPVAERCKPDAARSDRRGAGRPDHAILPRPLLRRERTGARKRP